MTEKPKTILLVEDEVPLRNILEERLKERGLEVICATTVDEGWKIISRGTAFDALFTDYNTYSTLNGGDLLRKLREREDAAGEKRRPVIVASGGDFMRDSVTRKEFVESLGGVFFLKPFPIADLFTVFSEERGFPPPPAAGHTGP